MPHIAAESVIDGILRPSAKFVVRAGCMALAASALLTAGCERRAPGSAAPDRPRSAGRTAMPAARGPLFPMIGEDGRMGFIDTSGTVVIEPRFHAVGDFSEGLAAAREGGLYGYIDSTGEYVISPRWDYATEFRYGRAVVYEDSVPIVIDRTGRKVFGGAFAAIESYENGVAVVRARAPWSPRSSGRGSEPTDPRLGLVDTAGRMIIDTVLAYLAPRPFREGLAVVWVIVDSLGHVNPDGQDMEAAVIDTLGSFVIPPGRFRGIRDEGGDIFHVYSPRELERGNFASDDAIEGFADRTGRLQFSRRTGPGFEFTGAFREGLVPVRVGPPGGCPSFGPGSERCHAGFLDAEGRMAFSSPDWEHAREFHHGRAVVFGRWPERGPRPLWVIDTKGRVLNSRPLRLLPDARRHAFEDGFALFLIDGKESLIDTNLDPVLPPESPAAWLLSLPGGPRTHAEVQDYERRRWPGRPRSPVPEGIPFLRGKMDAVDERGFRGGLLAGRVDRRLTYIDRGGRIVWRQAEWTGEGVWPIDIDYRSRGVNWIRKMPTLTQKLEEPHGVAGWIARLPFFQPPRDTLWIDVDARRKIDVEGKFLAHPVRIVNTLGRPISFWSPNEGLPMRVQARTPSGVWRDIVAPSRLPPASDATIPGFEGELGEGGGMRHVVPVFAGSVKTMLRLALDYRDTDTEWVALRRGGMQGIPRIVVRTTYSNEFPGNVNPGQLWREEWDLRNPFAYPSHPWREDRARR